MIFHDLWEIFFSWCSFFEFSHSLGHKQTLDQASWRCQLQAFLQKLARHPEGLVGGLLVVSDDMPGIYSI
jgi:hypothetical protein